MKEENNSYIGFALFFFLIVVIVAFGTFVIFLNKSEYLIVMTPKKYY